MQSLSVRYRPIRFEDVCGQTSIIKILNQMITTNNIKNSLLFCGASGCGKTTVARIFAAQLNTYTDTFGNTKSSEPIEIDAASNNGVDNIRMIIESAQERSIDGKYKVFILDEVHMLTSSAWNALLKLIEEPPEFTIFIFCTTDPQKIPTTIANRCLRFNFNRLNTDIINNRLQYICANEHFYNYQEACTYISKISNGGMRDAISMLDKCSLYSTDLNMNNVLAALGNFSVDIYFSLVNNLIDGNSKVVMQILDSIYNEGQDLGLMINQFLSFILDIQKYIIFSDMAMTSIPSMYEPNIKNSINFQSPEKYYLYLIDRILNLKSLLKNDSDPKSTISALFLKICNYK